ncbi:MAG TPA: efflux RND transporter periplasmic adaptor subunit [Bacteroidales bacterium]|nr:efflux RND transporter periplasmic adaptor subunit [Bacteroidales bacterium]
MKYLSSCKRNQYENECFSPKKGQAIIPYKLNIIMMKKLALLTLVMLVCASCSQLTENPANEKQAISVVTQKVERVKCSTNLRYSGTVEASQTIPLTFQTTGIVEQVYVQEGDAVSKGQLLAVLDKNDLQNIYDASYSKYQQAKDAYDRLKTVYDQGSLPEIKWVEMQTNFEQAKSSKDLAKNNLDKCYMRAPESGIIGRRNIEPGQSAFGLSSAPFELVKINQVMVKIAVPENEISKVRKGLKASFSVSALDERRFEGTITNVSPVADAISRTYTAKILVNNPKHELLPGMVCDVELDVKLEKDVLTVPYSAVTTGNDGKPFVFVVSGDKKTVKKQIVETGNYQNSNIEILNGLTEGQTIVVVEKEKLSDNSLIRL